MKLLERAAAIDDALKRVAPDADHSLVMGEAIRNAGTLNIPTDRLGFLKFVSGPLFDAANSMFGQEVAQALADDLTRSVAAEDAKFGTKPLDQLPPDEMAAPTRAVSGSSKETLDYGADLQSVWCDIVLYDPHRESEAALQPILERRGYRLFAATTIKKLVELCRRRYVHAVVADLEPGGYSLAQSLRVELGPETPPALLVGGSVALHAPRPGVFRVVPAPIDSSVADSLDELPRRTKDA